MAKTVAKSKTNLIGTCVNRQWISKRCSVAKRGSLHWLRWLKGDHQIFVLTAFKIIMMSFTWPCCLFLRFCTLNPELGGEYGGSSEKSCWIEATYLESLITMHKLCKMNTIAIHVTLSKSYLSLAASMAL